MLLKAILNLTEEKGQKTEAGRRKIHKNRLPTQVFRLTRVMR